MKKQIKMNLLNVFFIFNIIFISCQQEECFNKNITIYILNELQECEENNLHYTIEYVKENSCKYLEGEIILPILTDKLNTEEYNNLFFPAESKNRVRLVVEGFYSKAEHKNYADGCIGSHTFTITKILEKEVVNNEYDYPINNK